MSEPPKPTQLEVDEAAYKLLHHDVRTFITRRADHNWARPAIIEHLKGIRNDLDAFLEALDGKTSRRKDTT